MGLDMYLNGHKFLVSFGEGRPMEDGFPLKGKELELGYWRKHPNLHGYIVQNFAKKDKDGTPIDDCRPIELEVDDLRKILAASEADALPFTEGFFFGRSMDEDKPATKKILEDAIRWLETQEPEVWKSVEYEASW